MLKMRKKIKFKKIKNFKNSYAKRKFYSSFKTACAAASFAIGTLNGEQLT
jgi:hypothetical protein